MMKRDLLIKSFYCICDYARTLFAYINQLHDVLVLLKIGDKYVSYVFFEDKCRYNNIIQPLESSPIRFISIKYSHPKMKDNLYLELDNTMYIISNSLFSPVFVRRLLEYQTEDFVFDKNYKLVIMDNNINTIELDFTKYIILEKESYNIINMDTK
jgi:hypothetical protein